MPHRFDCRVYYEDADLAGIVYYANYLKYIERARTELVRSLGIDQTRMKADQGLVFAVRRIEADYLLAAKYDDILTVETRLLDATGARMTLAQDIKRDSTGVFSAIVTLVCLLESGKPARIPADIRRKLQEFQG